MLHLPTLPLKALHTLPPLRLSIPLAQRSLHRMWLGWSRLGM